MLTILLGAYLCKLNKNKKEGDILLGIIKTIIKKLKLKELFAIVFVTAIVITFVPNEWAQRMKIDSFRNTYQTYLSICIICICCGQAFL